VQGSTIKDHGKEAKMIGTTTDNTLALSLYSNKNQSINSMTYQQSGQISQQEKLHISTDQINLSYSVDSQTTYNRSMSLEDSAGDGYDLLRGLVLNIFKEQGIDYKVEARGAEVDISTISPEKAQEMIADDGYFGVEKTSDRIVNFAIGLAGGDPARIDAIRQGVKNGFEEALDAFGGWLPDISYDTYDAVMNKLDGWGSKGNTPQSLT